MHSSPWGGQYTKIPVFCIFNIIEGGDSTVIEAVHMNNYTNSLNQMPFLIDLI